MSLPSSRLDAQPTAQARVDPAWLLSLLAVLLISFPTLFWGFGRDQGNLGYMGWMLTRGKWPYLATWDSNFPGVVLIQAAEILLFGQSMFAFRVFDLIALLLTVSFLYAIARYLANRWAGLCAAVSYALLYLSLGYWHTGQREGYATLFTLAGMWALLHYRQSLARKVGKGLRWLVAAGLAGGCAFLIRPQFALLLLGLLGWTLWQDMSERRPDPMGTPLRVVSPFGNLAILTGLFALPILLWIVLYAFNGGLNEFLATVISYNLQVHSNIQQDLADIWSNFTQFVPLFLWVGTAWLVLTLKRGEQRSRYALLLFGVLVLDLAARLIERKCWEYHRIPVFALASAMGSAGMGLALSWLMSGMSRRRKVAIVAVILFGFLLWFRTASPWRTLGSVISTGSIEGDFPKQTMYRVFTLETDYEVAQYVKEKTNPDDRIQVWGGAATIYYLAQREASSRFQASASLVAHRRGGDLIPLQERWRQEFLAELHNRPPEYFIVEDKDWATYMGLAEDQNSYELLVEFTELNDWVKRNYYLDGVIGNFRLYARTLPSFDGR
jgi:hypothetical protein